MDMEMLKYFAGLGVGGMLAWGMFLVYRKDVKGQADVMTQIVKENTAAITKNTDAVSNLTTYLRANSNGNGPHA